MSEPKIKKQALLIGINEYQILPELKYARQDAEAVEQALKQNYCFSDDEVMLLTDAKPGLFKPSNRRIIEKHLEKLASQDLDLFIFGFWGHGLFRNGQRYFCPLDAISEDIEELGLSFDSLQRLLSNVKAKNTCLILDCCQKVHDRGDEEVLTAADQAVMENAARDIVLKRQEAEPTFQSNVAILNSCKQGQAAYEWENRKHGIFTAHLLDAMNRRFDSVAQIVGYISNHVEKTAMELGKTQTPFYKLEGDISLPVDTSSSPLVTGDVFVSYRHCNADLVAPVEEELKRRGISYFIDREGVNYGMEYSEALTQAIVASKLLLLFWTPEVKGSPDIVKEVTLAQECKKPVIPYKIGNFNHVEHTKLCYHIAHLSRYEVPKQTPATVTELVNRVEMTLSGKQPVSQVTFALPENSKDAVIEKPVIEDIKVTFTQVHIERQQPIQYNAIQLPPLPEELIKIPAENKGRENAIAQLRDFTHESLSQANAAVAQAQAQFDAWSERKERLWKDLSKDVQQSLEKTILDNPKCTEADINVSTDNMSNQEYIDLLERFECGKKHEQARQELERVQIQRHQKCEDVVKEIRQKIESENARAETIKIQFLDKVLFSILGVLPGYDKLDVTFPLSDFLDPLRLLDKYELGWRAPVAIARARVLWDQQRPCVLERKRKEEQKKEAEEERNKQIKGLLDAALIMYRNNEYAKAKATVEKALTMEPNLPNAKKLLDVCCLKLKEEEEDKKRKAGARKTITVNGVEFAFRWCPAGTFMMGSPMSEDGRFIWETQHKVTLTKGFWMMETQVTQKQWKAVMGNNPSDFQFDDLPVENVSWNDCQEFCKKCAQLGLPVQLPTEAQWEYACRAGSTGTYAGNLDEMAWYNRSGGTHPVGTKKPNAWGLYDMHGNVWEWCQDWYGGYPSESVTNPVGPSSGSYRVIRGGSWNCYAQFCRSATRDDDEPGNRSHYLGFRAIRGQ